MVQNKQIKEETYRCYHCDNIIYFNWNETHISCDIIEGQYTEFIAIICDGCSCENRW